MVQALADAEVTEVSPEAVAVVAVPETILEAMVDAALLAS